MEFVDDLVVVGIVLETAACIHRTRDAETIQLTEKQTRRIELIFT